jgi:hypothetical protein
MLKDFQTKNKNALNIVSSAFLDKNDSMQNFLKTTRMITELNKGVQGIGGMIYPSLL